MKLLKCLIVAFTLSLNAQDNPIGFKIGGLVSNISGDGTEDISGSSNFQAGFFTEIKAAPWLSIQPELLYTVYGFIDKNQDRSKIRLSYVALPIIARFNLSDTFSFDIGPQVGILVSADGVFILNGDLDVAFKSQDLGMNIGAGINFTEKLGMTLRYYLGFSDVISDERLKNQNRAIQLAIQYKFN